MRDFTPKMSNDSSYTIRITGPPKRIDELLEYLEVKLNRWETWQKMHRNISSASYKKALAKTLRELGMNSLGEFVSWGFLEENRISSAKKDTLTLHAWANENSTNTPISGAEGELRVLYDRFSDLSYKVRYQDDYSSGSCYPPVFEKDFGGSY